MQPDPTASSTTAPAPGCRPWRRRIVLVPVAAVVVLLLAAVLAAFQPWKLVVDDVVDEAAPLGVGTQSVPPAGPTTAVASPSATPAPAAPVTVLAGTFISHEHGTSGSVALLRLADGSRVLRLTGLDTSNGPDLHVWVTDQEVVDGPSGWTVFDDGRYVDLGALKGNKGNQNYAVPPDVDLAGLTSVSIWCARFHVSFGAATLES